MHVHDPYGTICCTLCSTPAVQRDANRISSTSIGSYATGTITLGILIILDVIIAGIISLFTKAPFWVALTPIGLGGIYILIGIILLVIDRIVNGAWNQRPLADNDNDKNTFNIATSGIFSKMVNRYIIIISLTTGIFSIDIAVSIFANTEKVAYILLIVGSSISIGGLVALIIPPTISHLENKPLIKCLFPFIVGIILVVLAIIIKVKLISSFNPWWILLIIEGILSIFGIIAINNSKNNFLIVAIKKEYLFILRLLILIRANVNLVDSAGETPLIKATRYNMTKSAELLINHGSNINAETAVVNGIRIYPNFTALIWAVNNGNENIVTMLINNNVNVNFVTLGRTTALHTAVREGHINIITRLAEYRPAGGGANLEVINRDEDTSLTMAIKTDKMEIAKLLIELGANVNHRTSFSAHDTNGNIANNATSLNIMASKDYENVNIVNQLLMAGAIVDNIRQPDNVTPLLCAAFNGHYNIVHSLIEAGANVNHLHANPNKNVLSHAKNSRFDRNLMRQRKIRKELIEQGATLPHGSILLNGTILLNGSIFPNGAIFPNGNLLPEGATSTGKLSLPGGTVLGDGFELHRSNSPDETGILRWFDGHEEGPVCIK